MKKTNSRKWGAALGAVVMTTVGSIPQARAELVYENNAAAPRIEDREVTRQALNASEKAQVTIQAANPQPVVVQAQPAQPQIQVVAPPAPVAASAPTQSSVQQVVIPQQLTLTGTASNTNSNSNLNDDSVGNSSRTELMRRSRMREEVKNEDMLQERLEELRLRDEQRRTNQLLGTPGLQPGAGQTVTQTSVQEQTVVVPVTERPGEPEEQPVVTRRASPKRVSSETLLVSESESRASLSSDYPAEHERTLLSIQPRFGMSSMDGGAGTMGYYDIHSRFGAGLGLDVATSDNVSLELGYTYSEYGIAATSSNPATAFFQSISSNGETLALKQNVFDAGLKLHLLGADSTLRPFVSAGGGYARSYLNYDDRILSLLRSTYNYGGQSDYSVSQFLGYLGAGLDVKVTRKIAAGLNFRYYHVLSANENSSLNPYGFAGYGAGGYAAGYNSAYAGAVDPDKQSAGGSLAHSDFYSILGTVSFTF